MDKFIIISGHRVGSRWLHYMLADLYGLKVSPEIDGSRIDERKNEIRGFFNTNKIPKFHQATTEMVLRDLKPHNYKIIGMVRNPLDRAVSFAFHNRYHDSDFPFPQKKLDTDLEAVEHTVFKDENFRIEEDQQGEIMLPGLSTKSYSDGFDSMYIWTTYEWMKANPKQELSIISKFLNSNVDKLRINRTVRAHSFRNKADRSPGDEKRDDLWRRKGIVGDYKNWLNDAMLEYLQPDLDRYNSRVDREINGN
jgi:hypothetical protein